MNVADRLLRGEIAELPSARALLLLGGAGGAVLGAALGASSGEAWLSVFAAVKVPLLLLATTAMCLPSFYVLLAALGLRDDLLPALRGVLAAQATLGLTLGALAPVTVVTAFAVDNAYLVTLLDAALFALATWAAQQVLKRHYAPLLRADPRHRTALIAWLVLYAFAGVQAAWVLRPFRGTEGFPVQFLRPEAFEQNAYVVLLEHVLRLGR